MNYKEIGMRIKRERISHAMTQSTVAHLADISLSFYGHIERGTRIMSIDTLCKLCKALNTDVHYILWGKAPVHSPSTTAELDAHDKAIVSNYLTDMLQTLK